MKQSGHPITFSDEWSLNVFSSIHRSISLRPDTYIAKHNTLDRRIEFLLTISLQLPLQLQWVYCDYFSYFRNNAKLGILFVAETVLVGNIKRDCCVDFWRKNKFVSGLLILYQIIWILMVPNRHWWHPNDIKRQISQDFAWTHTCSWEKSVRRGVPCLV